MRLLALFLKEEGIWPQAWEQLSLLLDYIMFWIHLRISLSGTLAIRPMPTSS